MDLAEEVIARREAIEALCEAFLYTDTMGDMTLLDEVSETVQPIRTKLLAYL